MTKCILIPVSGPVEELNLEGYTEIRNVIDGPLEGLCINDQMFAYIHEEGKMEGLEINVRATTLCTLKQTGLAPSDMIVGPMLVFGPIGTIGQDADIYLEDARDLLALGNTDA